MAPLLLLAIAFAWPAAIARCAALSVQPRRPTAGYRVSSRAALDADASTRLFGIRKPSVVLPNNDGDAPLVRNACSKNNRNDPSRGVHYNEEASPPHCNMLRSIALIHGNTLIATGRRLSFLALSVMLVNFIRSTIFKIPPSDKKMFDECPWPFTLFHDPIKFAKDGATHVVAVWVVLCQLYSRFEKARLVVPSL